MRVVTLNTLMGIVGLATLMAAAPLDAPDTCDFLTTTVFVTAKPSTITVHDAPTSTVYVTVQESVTLGQIYTTPILSASAITLPNPAKSADPSIHYVTVTQTALVTAHADALASSSDVAISYYVNGTSTIYLNGQAPSGSVVYASSTATLTVEPEPSKSADPTETNTSSIKITITVTEHRTVTGILSALKTSTLGANPSFTGIASGGWNGTSSGAYATGRGPTYAVPTGVIVTGVFSHVAVDAVSSALAAQSGFGGIDPASVSKANQNFDFTTKYSAASLSTLSAKSGFNALATPYTNVTTSTPASSTSEAAQPNATYVSVPSGTPIGAAPTNVDKSTTGLSTSAPSLIVAASDSSIALSPSTSLSSSATPTSGLNQTLISVLSASTPSASACGEIGDFVLNFDDIPPLAIGNQSADSVDPAPVFSPYHQFDFSNGFVVVPPPTDPYLPSSGNQLTEFIPNFTVNNSTTSSGPNSAQGGFSADIGNGDHDRTGCFRFNFYGGSVGCDSKGPSCLFTFTGLRGNKNTGDVEQVASASLAIDACSSLNNCKLTPVHLGTPFEDLTVIRINLTVGGKPKIWWMDDIRMGWTDNTCKTGICRVDSHIRKRHLQLAQA